jgi:hypothetical protein
MNRPNILWICTPSRTSFLTGTYPSTAHVNGNGNDLFPANLTLVTKPLAENDSSAQHLVRDLLQRSFDASMPALDRGPARVGPM